jgi:hypothetical protein
VRQTQTASNRLADRTRARVVALWSLVDAGHLTRAQFRTQAAAVVAGANTAGVSLADIGLAAEITKALRTPTRPLGLRPDPIQSDQARMGRDIDRLISTIDEPAEALGQWARSEPLLTVATAVQTGMKGHGIERWTRGLSGQSCPLCTGWADGVARPVTVSMVRHPGCDCIQQPVL